MRTRKPSVTFGRLFRSEVHNRLQRRTAMRTIWSAARRAGIAVLAVALFPPPGHGQLRNDLANAISKDDPIYACLAAYQAAMQRREEEDKQIRSTFQDWIRVNSPAAAQLFPNLRFASLRWDMH